LNNFCTRDLFWHIGHVLPPSWAQNSTACKHEEDKWELGSVIQTPASILWVALWAPTTIWRMILSLGLVLVIRPRVIEYSQCSTTLPGQCDVYCISIPNQSPSQSTTSVCKLCQCHVYCMLPISNLAGEGTTHIIVTPYMVVVVHIHVFIRKIHHPQAYRHPKFH